MSETWKKNQANLFRAGVTMHKNFAWVSTKNVANQYRKRAINYGQPSVAREIFKYNPPRNLKLLNLKNPVVVRHLKNQVLNGNLRRTLNHVLYQNTPTSKVKRRSGYIGNKYIATALKQLKNKHKYNYNGFIYRPNSNNNNDIYFEILLLGNVANSKYFQQMTNLNHPINFNRYRVNTITGPIIKRNNTNFVKKIQSNRPASNVFGRRNVPPPAAPVKKVSPKALSVKPSIVKNKPKKQNKSHLLSFTNENS